MAQDRSVEMIAAAPSIADLRTAVAQTRTRIGMTVNAIEAQVTTMVEGVVPHNGARMLRPTGRTLALVVLCIGFGLTLWLQRRKDLNDRRRPHELDRT